MLRWIFFLQKFWKCPIMNTVAGEILAVQTLAVFLIFLEILKNQFYIGILVPKALAWNGPDFSDFQFLIWLQND